MDRVETLIQKLQSQIKNTSSLDDMLVTVRMIESEMLHLRAQQPSSAAASSAMVNMPAFEPSFITEKNVQELVVSEPEIKDEEKIISVLEVDEAAIEAELEEIKKNMEAVNKMSSNNKPQLFFDPVEDTPTLIHQQPDTPPQKKEIHQNIPTISGASLNDSLKQGKIELSDSLQETAIKDLRKAVGLNDRFLFINELFRGDETMYERSIKTINGFSILPEAEFWIRRELKLKLGWSDTNPVVKQFDQLVKRRFA